MRPIAATHAAPFMPQVNLAFLKMPEDRHRKCQGNPDQSNSPFLFPSLILSTKTVVVVAVLFSRFSNPMTWPINPPGFGTGHSLPGLVTTFSCVSPSSSMPVSEAEEEEEVSEEAALFRRLLLFG